MAKYFLKLSGSNNIEGIIEWDGVTSYTTPPGYVVELATTTASINYTPSSSLYTDPIFGGKLFGEFEGDLINPTFNGETLYEVLNNTPYGTVTLYTSSVDNVFINSGSFSISGSKLNLPLSVAYNEKYPYISNYSSSFAKILNDEITEYILVLKNDCIRLDFLITNSKISTANSASLSNDYIELDYGWVQYKTSPQTCFAGNYGDKIYSNQTLNENDLIDFFNSDFYVDIEITDIDKKINNATNKRKTITYVSSTTDITVPCWADKITVYAVGAGGGGGGGASGYAHTGSTSYMGILGPEIFSTIAEGTPGNYTPKQDSEIGHEFVTGGGGGAGGCVVITTLKGDSVITNRDKKMTIFIGDGGEGGSGSSYLNDVVAKKYLDSTNASPYLSEHNAWKVVESVYGRSLQSDPTNELDFSTAVISPFGELYNGKPGSDTMVFLDGKKIVQAQGGNGGTAGFSLKAYFPPFHLTCDVPDHIPANVFVPGGANDSTSNFPKNAEIRIGGPGGYGVSMPTLFQSNPYTSNFEDRYEISAKTFFANVAPDIPFAIYAKRDHVRNIQGSVTYAPEINNLSENLSKTFLPYGNTTRKVSYRSEHLKYSSNGNILPEKPAPTGGGGGVGATYKGLDQRSFELYNDFREAMQRQPLDENILQLWSNKVTGSISYGFGGVSLFNDYLINDIDENGITYQWPTGSWDVYYGGSGGYGSYGINTDNTITEWAGNPVINGSPSSGLFFAIEEAAGYGGGGGAGRYVLNYEDKYRTDNEQLYPTRGQNGANGQDGFCIIVFEYTNESGASPYTFFCD
jgi:hypothetical protein